MKRITLGFVTAALLCSVVALATDGPLTPLMNLKTRTDANGYLMTTIGVYSGADGPLTAMANLRGRTDANGYLLTVISGALADAQTFLFGAATASVGGTLTTSTAANCTIADTNETNLWTYSLPASTLNANGRGLRVTAFGNTAANANTKRVRLYFGATAISDTAAIAANSAGWKVRFDLLRTSATAQVAVGEWFVTGTSATVNTFVTPAETLSGAVTIKATGLNGTANANDICIRGAFVETIK